MGSHSDSVAREGEGDLDLKELKTTTVEEKVQHCKSPLQRRQSATPGATGAY
jgi:hypothetical protein